MAGWRQVVELAMSNEEVARLAAVSRSRTEPASRVMSSNASRLPGESIVFCGCTEGSEAITRTVQRCVERALAMAPWWLFNDRPRPGKEPTITPQAKAWLVASVRQGQGVSARAVDHAPARRHAREHGAGRRRTPGRAGSGHRLQDSQPGGNQAAQGALPGCGTPSLVKMAEVLCVYRKVEVLKRAAWSKTGKPVAIVSCDGRNRAIATTSPDLPPVPGVHPTFARDHEYKRHGTLSLLAKLICSPARSTPCQGSPSQPRVHRTPKLLDAAYPEASTAIKLILDNHSAHISKETKAWLTCPAGRFEFTFHAQDGPGSANLVEEASSPSSPARSSATSA